MAPYRVRVPLPPLPPDVLRAPARMWAPWEPCEDCVLVAVAARAAAAATSAQGGAVALGEAVWQLASDMLAANAAALGAAAGAAQQQQARCLWTVSSCLHKNVFREKGWAAYHQALLPAACPGGMFCTSLISGVWLAVSRMLLIPRPCSNA